MTLGVMTARTNARNVASRPCACGTGIVAVNDSDGIALAVRSHNRLPEHLAWRRANDASPPTFDVAIRKRPIGAPA